MGKGANLAAERFIVTDRAARFYKLGCYARLLNNVPDEESKRIIIN